MNRHSRGDRQLVDGRNTLLGVDEQPAPVQRNHLDLYGRLVGDQGFGRIQVVGTDPRHPTQKRNRERRDRPDDQLNAAGVFPVRFVLGSPVAVPEPPGKDEREHDDRNDHRQHDRRRIGENDPLGKTDWPMRIQHALPTRSEHDARNYERERPRSPPLGTTISRRTVEGTVDSVCIPSVYAHVFNDFR